MSNPNCCVGCKIGFKDKLLGHICKKNSYHLLLKLIFQWLWKILLNFYIILIISCQGIFKSCYIIVIYSDFESIYILVKIIEDHSRQAMWLNLPACCQFNIFGLVFNVTQEMSNHSLYWSLLNWFRWSSDCSSKFLSSDHYSFQLV